MLGKVELLILVSLAVVLFCTVVTVWMASLTDWRGTEDDDDWEEPDR